MDPDQTFRILLIGFALILVPMGVYHRIKSQVSGEKLDRRQEGIFILATLRPLGVALWLGVGAYMLNPAWMSWASMPLPIWLRWTGVAVSCLAAALLWWTLHNLGKNLTDTVVTRQAHTLIVDGPDRWVRHPFYDCATLLALAVSLMAANWFFLMGGVVLLGLFMIRTRTEEKNLLARFGADYRDYVARTGRFLPKM